MVYWEDMWTIVWTTGTEFNVYSNGQASGSLLDGEVSVVVTRGNPTA